MWGSEELRCSVSRVEAVRLLREAVLGWVLRGMCGGSWGPGPLEAGAKLVRRGGVWCPRQGAP